MNDFTIRTMRPDEISLAVDWAAAEGWNPGLADAACFASVDPEGFFIGELDGKPAATVSCVNYGASFAFLGFYIVRADLRGSGYGLRIWNAAIAHAGPRVIGLDGVVAQQDNYRKSGFQLAYANVRYGGTVAAPAAPPAGIIALSDVPFAAVEADDATVFPAPRSAFLRAWIGAPGHVGCAFMRNGRLAGWGVIRPCRKGFKIGPLVADDRATAEAVLSALLAPAWAAARFFWMCPASTATPSHWRRILGSRRCSRRPACIPARFRRCGWSGCSASPALNWGRSRARSGHSHNHPVPGERGAHSLVNADGSLLSAYHLREHLAARDRVCAGNAWIEIGRPARESTFAAGRSPMKRRMVPMLMPAGAARTKRRGEILTSALAGRETSAIAPCGQPFQPVALCGAAVRARCRAGCLAPLFAGAAPDRSSVDPVARFVLHGVVAARRYST